MSYKVKFDTGQTVEFQNQPSDTDIEEVVKKLGIKPKSASIPEEPKQQKRFGGIGDVLTGIGKGATQTAVGLGQVALKGYNLIPGLPGKDLVRQSIETGEDIKRTQLAPENTAQKIGKVGEQIGEFFIPTGAGAKGLQLGSKLTSKAPKLAQGIAKLGGQSLGEAVEFAGKTFLQTGGDTGESIKAGVIGGVATPITKGIGAVAKGVFKVLPEKLYAQIFKRSQDDLRLYYQSVAKGKKIDPTLAKEIMDRGLMGNSKNLAVYSFKKLNDLEKAVQAGAKGKTIKITQTRAYTNLLNDIKVNLGQPLFSPLSREASVIAKEIAKSEGKQIPIKTVLKLRRLLDSARNTSSFKLDTKLAAKQETFKKAADLLRQKISNAGLKDLMNEERIFIEALDSIISDAVRRQNKALLGLTDVLLGGGGLATGATGVGIGIAGGVRAFQQPFSLTTLGQGLNKAGKLGEKLKAPQILKGASKTIPPLTRE